jgi:hypothetical protein
MRKRTIQLEATTTRLRVPWLASCQRRADRAGCSYAAALLVFTHAHLCLYRPIGRVRFEGTQVTMRFNRDGSSTSPGPQRGTPNRRRPESRGHLPPQPRDRAMRTPKGSPSQYAVVQPADNRGKRLLASAYVRNGVEKRWKTFRLTCHDAILIPAARNSLLPQDSTVRGRSVF